MAFVVRLLTYAERVLADAWEWVYRMEHSSAEDDAMPDPYNEDYAKHGDERILIVTKDPPPIENSVHFCDKRRLN
jgi:hypothetical protein